MPKVAVLMATYNGARWIREQIETILAQKDVEIRLLISDDGSTDGTVDIINEYATKYSYVTVLPRRTGASGVAGNFFYLFQQCNPEPGEFVAFTDQDDLWFADKLAFEVDQIQARGVDALSTNVEAFTPEGDSWLVDKAQDQTEVDYLFEAAGPGCTYVFTYELHGWLKAWLDQTDTSLIDAHDWYLYAMSRAIGARWAIVKKPTLSYRQHENNVQGANSGVAAFRVRLRRLWSGFYLRQFQAILEHAIKFRQVMDMPVSPEMVRMQLLLANGSIASRFKLFARSYELRRRNKEGFLLGLARLFFVW